MIVSWPISQYIISLACLIKSFAAFIKYRDPHEILLLFPLILLRETPMELSGLQKNNLVRNQIRNKHGYNYSQIEFVSVYQWSYVIDFKIDRFEVFRWQESMFSNGRNKIPNLHYLGGTESDLVANMFVSGFHSKKTRFRVFQSFVILFLLLIITLCDVRHYQVTLRNQINGTHTWVWVSWSRTDVLCVWNSALKFKLISWLRHIFNMEEFMREL